MERERKRLYPTIKEYEQYKKILKSSSGMTHDIDVEKLYTTKENFEKLLKRASDKTVVTP